MAKSVTQYFKEVKQEGKKVTWPGRREVIVTTVIVFIMVVFISLFLMLADFVVAGIIEAILGINS
tara:strand:+ start:644 stop:838 length:195 start_codon:yes stop_codon:yes gene_type:complete